MNLQPGEVRGNVITAVGASGNRTGLPVGARCNRLYVDLTRPWIPFFGTIHSVGYWRLRNNPLFNNLELWVQAAWKDSVSGEFSLTSANHLWVPAIPTVQRLAIYSHNGTLRSGKGPDPQDSLLPITRYEGR